ncbi:MAG: ribonuclease E, partial [Cyanobacteriota bacterium]|nr:ribonuclease E [Cyanobacteriota bacterium]
RRGGRIRTGAVEMSAHTPPSGVANGVESTTSVEPERQEPSASSEGVIRRQEPELVAVSMDSGQEEVFAWLGLNPLLLIEPPPENDNLLVRVVRPGEDAESVLEEAREQLSASSNRRRRRGRGGARGAGRGAPEASVETPSSNGTEVVVQQAKVVAKNEPLSVQITPLEVDHSSSSASVETVSSISEPQESEPEDPRRRRRRSSAAG